MAEKDRMTDEDTITNDDRWWSFYWESIRDSMSGAVMALIVIAPTFAVVSFVINWFWRSETVGVAAANRLSYWTHVKWWVVILEGIICFFGVLGARVFANESMERFFKEKNNLAAKKLEEERIHKQRIAKEEAERRSEKEAEERARINRIRWEYEDRVRRSEEEYRKNIEERKNNRYAAERRLLDDFENFRLHALSQKGITDLNTVISMYRVVLKSEWASRTVHAGLLKESKNERINQIVAGVYLPPAPPLPAKIAVLLPPELASRN